MLFGLPGTTNLPAPTGPAGPSAGTPTPFQQQEQRPADTTVVGVNDVVTKMDTSNRLMAKLVQAVSDRTARWELTGALPISQGGTGATTAADARDNLGLGTAGGVIYASWFGPIGTADDTATIQLGLDALTDGVTLDLGPDPLNVTSGLTLSTTGAGVTGSLVLTGANDTIALTISGNRASLTLSGASIAAGATTVTVVSASSVQAGDLLEITSGNRLISSSVGDYYKGEVCEVRSVSGNTLTLAGGTTFGYTTSIGLARIRPVERVRVNLDFTGDSTKTQAGVEISGGRQCQIITNGYNVGWYTAYINRSVDCRLYHTGANPGITADNGLDYGVVHANGNRRVFIDATGSEYRHVIAGGAETLVDIGVVTRAIGEWNKDSIVDCHPGVMNYATAIVSGRVRTGGTFSNQPVAFMYQGGGALVARVQGQEADTSFVTLQPFQNTVDSFDVEAVCTSPTAACIRIVDAQIMKDGGSVESVSIKASGLLTASGSRGVSLDTDTSASGLVIENVAIQGSAVAGLEYGVLVYARANHTIRSVNVIGNKTSGTPNGAYAVYVGGDSGGAVTNLMAVGNIMTAAGGSTTAIGLRTDARVAKRVVSPNIFDGFGTNVSPASTATATAGAATLNAPSGVVTSESLTTAAAGDYTLTLTNSFVTASSVVLTSLANGSNTTAPVYTRLVTPAAGSVVIVVRNAGAGALNGTLKIAFSVQDS